MSDTDFHWVEWLITFAIGLPTLAIVVWKRWKQAQHGFFWRAVLCIIVASLVTPAWWSEDFGGIVTVDIFPAVTVVPFGLVAIFQMGGRFSLADCDGIIATLFPILVVSAVLAAIWSLIRRSRRIRPGGEVA